jgi:DNA-binding response OmpR family regulator
MSPPKLLLVEDDAAVADVVAFHLRGAGYDVEHASDGHLALRRIESQRWDLVLLDVMLPGADGFEICRRLRAPPAAAQTRPQRLVPIIILSARTTEAERVLGLELGADDYLAKPFSMLELTARVRALLRRVDQLLAPAGSPLLHAGSLCIDLVRRKATLAGQELNLTLREFDLLHFLARHPGHIFGRGELLQRVWGDGFDGFEHTVNSHINRLRSKLEGDAAPAAPGAPPRLIETVWGMGYSFNVPTSPPAPGLAA